MTSRINRWRPLAGALLALGALFLTACDGSDTPTPDSSTSASATPSATASATASASPAASPSPSVTASPTPSAEPEPVKVPATPTAVPTPKAERVAPEKPAAAPTRAEPESGDGDVLLSPAGNRYKRGQFCKKAHLGLTTLDSHGSTLYCEMDGSRPRWQ
ncbi:hypothetical protein ACN20G_00475 [Streptomyces sp. BI20]|uniref:hypothetical protein n=1 Tax=Streptomyces sp. BI20 TaxID=3403460 RepID=UPI003C75F0E9